MHLKPGYKGPDYKEDDENKRIMAKLTLRRHARVEKMPVRGAEYVKERIEKLHCEEAERRKRLEIGEKSRERGKNNR